MDMIAKVIELLKEKLDYPRCGATIKADEHGPIYTCGLIAGHCDEHEDPSNRIKNIGQATWEKRALNMIQELQSLPTPPSTTAETK